MPLERVQVQPRDRFQRDQPVLADPRQAIDFAAPRHEQTQFRPRFGGPDRILEKNFKYSVL